MRCDIYYTFHPLCTGQRLHQRSSGRRRAPHLIGHHGALGAAAGCAIGYHEAAKQKSIQPTTAGSAPMHTMGKGSTAPQLQESRGRRAVRRQSHVDQQQQSGLYETTGAKLRSPTRIQRLFRRPAR
jgi:hypothetical protein